DDEKLITVDFFKVDLHNVFRMLREISGKNIIVAEGISGTLTLALNEVPWDFALDIIVNLKDLAKEERLNTIVIFPKDNEFIWPEPKTEIKFDPVDKEPDSPIRIDGSSGEGNAGEVIKAKKLVAQGSQAEKKGDLEHAVQLYGKAVDYWPNKTEKSKLANKIAMIYLVKLHQNAKAVYFAKKALAADKTNRDAALNAAIGHANMKENSSAQQYFDQSISNKKPSREALLNYAVFSEQQKQYDAALRLLSKFDELYGENLNSMVSRARILDKQGRKKDADKVYTGILHAGFSVPPDLREFITNRIGKSPSM
ncbi:MAG: energy transducer TonB, partial [Candidatus Electrothrix sp. AR3]|nr:energy transducer TonB [Candidatus Electrothrix sp. AR3]